MTEQPEVERLLIKSTPVIGPELYFDDNDEFQACAREWQERLSLMDWNIYFTLSRVNEMVDLETVGQAEPNWSSGTGIIRVLCREDHDRDELEKQPQELTLIHELLHFKLFTAGIENENPNIESLYFSNMQHLMLEHIAKALYMAKYDLNKDWWIN